MHCRQRSAMRTRCGGSWETMSPYHQETNTLIKMFNLWCGFLTRANHWRQGCWLHRCWASFILITAETGIRNTPLILETCVRMRCLLFLWTNIAVPPCLFWAFKPFSGTWFHGRQRGGNWQGKKAWCPTSKGGRIGWWGRGVDCWKVSLSKSIYDVTRNSLCHLYMLIQLQLRRYFSALIYQIKVNICKYQT